MKTKDKNFLNGRASVAIPARSQTKGNFADLGSSIRSNQKFNRAMAKTPMSPLS